VWNFLKRHFPQETTAELKGMRIFKNHKGAAFDVPEKYAHEFIEFAEKNKGNNYYTLQKADKLPEFEEEAMSHF